MGQSKWLIVKKKRVELGRKTLFAWNTLEITLWDNIQ
jgi:hypothetical protein